MIATTLDHQNSEVAFAMQDPDEISQSTDSSDDEFVHDPNNLTHAEVADLESSNDHSQPIAYQGRDFDVIGLIRRLKDEDLIVPSFGIEAENLSTAGFQRAFVWSRPQMDRLIESILLDYPIPEIFLIRQTDNRYLVLDGQQRLRTLQFFYEGVYGGREFRLQNVTDEFKGLSYKTLSQEQRRRFEGTFMQATILTSDGSAGTRNAIYSIFERLNAGGTKLTPHEIRVALFAGPLIEHLTSLNANDDWRALYGPHNKRLRDQELVLRIIALYENQSKYRRPLKTFLNSYLGDLNDSRTKLPQGPCELFQTAARLVNKSIGEKAIRHGSAQVNAALTEALFVGLMRSLVTGFEPSAQRVFDTIEQLKIDEELMNSVARSTANEQMVNTRLDVSTEAFAKSC